MESSMVVQQKLIWLSLPIFLLNTKASIVYCDNINSVYLARNPVRHQRTKHIEIDIHFVKERVDVGEVKVMFVSSLLQMFLQKGYRPVCSMNSEPA